MKRARELQAGTLLARMGIVLMETRFPENVGMAARACANMGLVACPEARIRPALTLVRPERWDKEKAIPLATAKGRAVLDTAAVCAALPQALEHAGMVIGATARTGGWRQGVLSPERAAVLAASELSRQNSVVWLFGPEDRGLTNAEIELCTHLVTIPSQPGASSLNVAQAVLLALYECRKAALAQPEKRTGARPPHPGIAHQDRERLYQTLEQALSAIDVLHGDNPDYFMMPVRRFFNKIELTRGEFDLFMGICRQILWTADKARRVSPAADRTNAAVPTRPEDAS